MKKKHILIWQSGEPLQIDGDNHNPMRAINLSNFFYDNNFKVTLISSNFNHTYKKFRKKNVKKFKILKLKSDFNLVLINSIGYKKNISITRLVDHFFLALNLFFFLKNFKEKVDFCIIGFPPIEPTIVLANWLFKKKIPYLIDVKDLWPEYFYERIKNKIISTCLKICFFTHNIKLQIALKNSYCITSNNIFFLNYILKKISRKKTFLDKVIYLTKPVICKNIPSKYKKIKINRKKLNIYFCGRINLDVFDFETVLKGLEILKQEKINYHFYVAGYGEICELKELIIKYKLKDEISVVGYVDKYKHSIFLQKCRVFIAPFFNNLNFSSNLSNKFIEAIQYNLPILTPLKKDVGKFIVNNNLGEVYKEKDAIDFARKIKNLIPKTSYSNPLKYKMTSLLKNEFSHETNYFKFIKIFNSIKFKL